MSHRDPTAPLATKLLFKYLKESNPEDLPAALQEALTIDRSRGGNLLTPTQRQLLSTDGEVLARRPSQETPIRIALRIVALAYLEPAWTELIEQNTEAIAAIEKSQSRPIDRELPKFATAAHLCDLRDRFDRLVAKVEQYHQIKDLEQRRSQVVTEHEEALAVLGIELTAKERDLLTQAVSMASLGRTDPRRLTLLIDRFVGLAEQLEGSWPTVNADVARFIEEHGDYLEASEHWAIPVLLEELTADSPLDAVQQRKRALAELTNDQVNFDENLERWRHQSPHRYDHDRLRPTAQAA